MTISEGEEARGDSQEGCAPPLCARGFGRALTLLRGCQPIQTRRESPHKALARHAVLSRSRPELGSGWTADDFLWLVRELHCFGPWRGPPLIESLLQFTRGLPVLRRHDGGGRGRSLDDERGGPCEFDSKIELAVVVLDLSSEKLEGR